MRRQAIVMCMVATAAAVLGIGLLHVGFYGVTDRYTGSLGTRAMSRAPYLSLGAGFVGSAVVTYLLREDLHPIAAGVTAVIAGVALAAVVYMVCVGIDSANPVGS